MPRSSSEQSRANCFCLMRADGASAASGAVPAQAEQPGRDLHLLRRRRAAEGVEEPGDLRPPLGPRRPRRSGRCATRAGWRRGRAACWRRSPGSSPARCPRPRLPPGCRVPPPAASCRPRPRRRRGRPCTRLSRPISCQWRSSSPSGASRPTRRVAPRRDAVPAPVGAPAGPAGRGARTRRGTGRGSPSGRAARCRTGRPPAPAFPGSPPRRRAARPLAGGPRG